MEQSKQKQANKKAKLWGQRESGKFRVWKTFTKIYILIRRNLREYCIHKIMMGIMTTKQSQRLTYR